MKINYQQRIEDAITKLGTGAMLILSQPEAIRNSDVGHSYRQESFLYYLTGLSEDNCALLLVPQQDKGVKTVLFISPKDPLHELWEGRRLGVEEAKKTMAIDEAFPIAELWSKLPQYVKGHTEMHYHLGRDQNSDMKVIEALSKIRRTKPRIFDYQLPIIDSDKISGELRQIKTKAEIERMQQAADVTKIAFDKILETTKPGMSEKEVYGTIVGEFYKHGADMEAYGSIVAGGDNACILHYVENNATLNDNELILIDAGAQFDYYASDVTRTFPIGAKFTKPQKQLYEIVLKANEESISMIRPGVTLPEVHQKSVDILVDGLIDLGLLKGKKEEIIKEGLYKKYFPHNTSHWLGMDVHDVGAYQVEDHGEWKPTLFKEGMVLTVEPGLYIPADDSTVDEAYRGIGIRIEDDIVVTDKGVLNFTASIPKSVSEIEKAKSKLS
jgi:Xaa-Pro aminopeptidase